MSIVRTSPTKRYSIAFVLLAILLAAFSTSPRPAQATGETTTIVIQGSTAPPGFSPSFLTIHVYDTVIFVNHSSPPANYAVSASDGSFSAPAIAPNQQWKVTFNSIGVHEFHSASAPQRMVGEILVVDNAVSLLPTSVPSVNATVVALIQSGHVPPDNLLVATPTSIAKQATKNTSITTLPLYIFIVLAFIGVLLLSALVYLLCKYLVSRKCRTISEEEYKEEEYKGLTET
jgi:plastocyanin